MTTERIESIPLAALVPSPTNPRRHISDAGLQELADSIRQIGLQQPIVVRPSTTHWHGGVHAWEIVFGHRRARAAELADLEFIPAIARTMTDDQVALAQLAENLQREDMSALDEADAVWGLRFERNLQPDVIARELGKSRSWVYGRLKMGGLDATVREALSRTDGRPPLPPDSALEIARLPTMAQQRAALKRVSVGAEWLSVREAQRIVRGMMPSLVLHPTAFDPADASLHSNGACGPCPYRAGNDPDLVAAGLQDDTCTQADCYSSKRLASAQRRLAELAAAGQRVATAEQAAAIFAKPLGYGEWHDVDTSDIDTRDDEWVSVADALAELGDTAPQPLHAVDEKTGKLYRVISDAEMDAVQDAVRRRRVAARGDDPAGQPAASGPADDPLAAWTAEERATLDGAHMETLRRQVLRIAARAPRTTDELRLVLNLALQMHGGEVWAEAVDAMGLDWPSDTGDMPGADWWHDQIEHMTADQMGALLVIEALADLLRAPRWAQSPNHGDRPRQQAAQRVAWIQRYGVPMLP